MLSLRLLNLIFCHLQRAALGKAGEIQKPRLGTGTTGERVAGTGCAWGAAASEAERVSFVSVRISSCIDMSNLGLMAGNREVTRFLSQGGTPILTKLPGNLSEAVNRLS